MVGKQRSTLAGLCEALSLMTSLALQHQVPVADIVRRIHELGRERIAHASFLDRDDIGKVLEYRSGWRIE